MTPDQIRQSFERLNTLKKNFSIGSRVYFAKNMQRYASFPHSAQPDEWQVLAATVVNYVYKDSLHYRIDVPGEESYTVRPDELFASLDECVSAIANRTIPEQDSMTLPSPTELLYKGHLYHLGDVVFMRVRTCKDDDIDSLTVVDFRMEDGIMVPIYRWYKFAGKEIVDVSLSDATIYPSFEAALHRPLLSTDYVPTIGDRYMEHGGKEEGTIVAFVYMGQNDTYIYVEQAEGRIRWCRYNSSCVQKR